MPEPGIVVNFEGGWEAVLRIPEAEWLRDELIKGEFGHPKRDIGLILDEIVARLAQPTIEETNVVELTRANEIELAWALRGMLDADSQRFLDSPGLVRLRDLLFFELQERPDA